MTYEAIILNDSGAVEFPADKINGLSDILDFEQRINKASGFTDNPPSIILDMYDDKEFNSLNDFIHGSVDFVVNDKVKAILERHKLPPHKFFPAIVRRKERKFGIKTFKSYNYFWFCFNCEKIDNYYSYINFKKSKIKFFKDKTPVDIIVNDISDIYKIIEENKKIGAKNNAMFTPDQFMKASPKEITAMGDQMEATINWKAEVITLNNSFDKNIDIFDLSLFSWMTFVSERLKAELIAAKTTDIKFVKTGVKSRLDGVQNPLIEFE